MISEKLKTATENNHQFLEKRLVAKMRSMKNLDDYTDLLQLFYSFFGGLEQLIDTYLNNDILPDYGERRKTQNLKSDIHYLKADVVSIVGNQDLPVITDAAQAMGALYVMEGSTLGGQIIKKMIGKQLEITDDKALSFFNGYGEQTNLKWKDFKSALDNAGLNEQSVIDTANETFLKFSQWFNK